jgi:hypothetical protein
MSVKLTCHTSNHDFFCVGVVYSGEHDVCDVTLVVDHSIRANLHCVDVACMHGCTWELPKMEREHR